MSSNIDQHHESNGSKPSKKELLNELESIRASLLPNKTTSNAATPSGEDQQVSEGSGERLIEHADVDNASLIPTLMPESQPSPSIDDFTLDLTLEASRAENHGQTHVDTPASHNADKGAEKSADNLQKEVDADEENTENAIREAYKIAASLNNTLRSRAQSNSDKPEPPQPPDSIAQDRASPVNTAEIETAAAEAQQRLESQTSPKPQTHDKTINTSTDNPYMSSNTALRALPGQQSLFDLSNDVDDPVENNTSAAEVHETNKGSVSDTDTPQSQSSDSDAAAQEQEALSAEQSNAETDGLDADHIEESPMVATESIKESLFDEPQNTDAEQAKDKTSAQTVETVQEENPFLPQHIKERLAQQKTSYERDLAISRDQLKASAKKFNSSVNYDRREELEKDCGSDTKTLAKPQDQHDDLVDELVGLYLPKIEAELRAKISERLSRDANKDIS